ncbi:MAG: pyruvate, orthophosphate dikinase, partial [Actinomycetota bacterium]|nr:pyruvate, orthophosphate dikinase [Actinomycetota bacterium]
LKPSVIWVRSLVPKEKKSASSATSPASRAARGRATKPGLKLGVCGEHGGDPESIALFWEAGLDYVSCSPFRVPIARLAAAQAILGNP